MSFRTVAFRTMESPIGELLVASGERGICRIAFLRGASEGEIVDHLESLLSRRMVRSDGAVAEASAELREYFFGGRTAFSMQLDWGLIAGFRAAVLRSVRSVPYGETVNYADVAALAGSPGAWRAAGSALASNPLPIVVPCHRVVPAGRGIGEYASGSDIKAWLLEHEAA